MNCKQFDDMLVDFLDGSLSKKIEREMKSHLQECDQCQRALTIYRQLLNRVQKLPPQKCPDKVVENLIEVLPLNAEKRHSLLRRLADQFFASLSWKISFASAIVLIIVSLIFFVPSKQHHDLESHYYTEEEVAQAQRDIKLAIGYFNHYAKKTSTVIEKQVLDQTIIKPMKETLKIAFEPIVRGGKQ